MNNTSSKQVAAALLEKDGTYTLNGEPVTYADGYQVGGVSPIIVNPTLKEATEWVGRVRNLHRDAEVGSWTDKGMVHLDVTVHRHRLQDAMRAARLWGEEAVWGWSEGESIHPGADRLRLVA